MPTNNIDFLTSNHNVHEFATKMYVVYFKLTMASQNCFRDFFNQQLKYIITRPSRNFNGGLTKPLLKLGNARLITFKPHKTTNVIFPCTYPNESL